jgi:ABC-type transport system involved in multi-copper enzyme maturation permease subunit
MSRSLIWRLVGKDLYLLRTPVLVSLLVGGLSIGLFPLGAVEFYVGSVSVLCVLIVLNVLLVMQGVSAERKERISLFVLSLPISTRDYTIAKLLSSGIAFAACWLLLSAGSLAMIAFSPVPDGLIPFSVLVLVYVVAYYCVYLGVAISTEAEGWTTAVIVGGNVSINFFVAWAMRLPAVSEHIRGPVAVWGGGIWTILAVEVAVALLALAVTFFVQSRKTDFA